MTCAAEFGHFAPSKEGAVSSKAGAIANKPGVLRRIFDAIIESRQKRVDREIAGLLARSGWRLTDSIEREITESLLTDNWDVCRRRQHNWLLQHRRQAAEPDDNKAA